MKDELDTKRGMIGEVSQQGSTQATAIRPVLGHRCSAEIASVLCRLTTLSRWDRPAEDCSTSSAEGAPATPSKEAHIYIHMYTHVRMYPCGGSLYTCTDSQYTPIPSLRA